MFVFMREQQVRHTQIRTYVSVIRFDATKDGGGVQVVIRVTPKKIKTDERKTKRQHTQNAQEEGSESTTVCCKHDQQLDRRGTQKPGVVLRKEKRESLATLCLLVLSKDSRGAEGDRNVRENLDRPRITFFSQCCTCRN